MLTPGQIQFFRNQAIILWENTVNKFDSQYYAQIVIAPDCPQIQSDTKIVFICFLLAKRIRDDSIESRRARYFIVSKDNHYRAYLCCKKSLTLTIENAPSQTRIYAEVPE